MAGDLVMIGIGQQAFPYLGSIKVRDEVVVDNSIYLAAQTYHRHQVPPSREYYAFDQFRGPNGKPLYPQRSELLGPKFAEQGAGCRRTARAAGQFAQELPLQGPHDSFKRPSVRADRCVRVFQKSAILLPSCGGEVARLSFVWIVPISTTR